MELNTKSIPNTNQTNQNQFQTQSKQTKINPKHKLNKPKGVREANHRDFSRWTKTMDGQMKAWIENGTGVDTEDWAKRWNWNPNRMRNDGESNKKIEADTNWNPNRIRNRNR